MIGHPVMGGSWEGWIIESPCAMAPPDTHANFYRSSGGAAIDLVLELPKRHRWAIKVKRTSAPAASLGVHIAAADFKASQRSVLHAGGETFPLERGVRETTLADSKRALVALAPSR